MTTEIMVQKWLDEYNEKKRRLSAKYDFGFNHLPVNSFGETSAEAVLNLNMWYVEKENKIRTEMMLKAKKMFEEKN